MEKTCVLEMVVRGLGPTFLVIRELNESKEILGFPGTGEIFPGVEATVKPITFTTKEEAIALIERLSLNNGGSIGFAHLWGKMRFVGDCLSDLNGR